MRQTVVIASAISVASSAVMLLFFCLLPRWRSKPGGFKHILLVTTVSNLVMAAAYFLDPRKPSPCVAQAGLQQFFEIACSWAYTCCLGVEVAFCVRRRQLATETIQEAWKEYRIVAMHALVLAYATGSTVALFALGANGRAGAWCWSPSAAWQLMSYSVLWAELLAILASSGVIIHELRDPTKHKYAVSRLFLIPTAWMILHVPGTIRRCHQLVATGCGWCESHLMRSIQGVCDPSQGTANLVLFGLTDKRLVSELRHLIRGAEGHRGSSEHGPLGDDDDFPTARARPTEMAESPGAPPQRDDSYVNPEKRKTPSQSGRSHAPLALAKSSSSCEDGKDDDDDDASESSSRNDTDKSASVRRRPCPPPNAVSMSPDFVDEEFKHVSTGL